MKTFWTLALFVLLCVPVASAQTLDRVVPRSLDPATTSDQPQVLHITDQLMNSPEGLAARAAFRELKAQGWQPPVHKSTAAIGDTMTFKVVNIEENQFDNIDFKLMAEADRFLVWVELAELDNGNVDDEVIDEVVNAMGNETPAGSINPNEGVIVNDEQIFGQPPNVDGDGKSDILLVDVRDGFDPQVGGGYVVGFISPNDLPGRGGNDRDILYLDTNPSLTSRGIELLGETAAHEYQHLIHLNYDTNEDTWVNEGLSEWAEVANGYDGRTIQYLNDPIQYNVSLLRWSGNSSPSVGQDYQRGGLFASYIAERIGTLATGSITREPFNGILGYRTALTDASANFTFDELLTDFHIANFLNDTNLDPRYGYTAAQRLGVRAAPTAVYDARVDTETPSTTLLVRPGAVQYYVWDQVTDLSVTLNGAFGSENLQTTVLLFQDGTLTTQAVDLGATSFSGEYDRIVFVLVNSDPDAGVANVNLSATWNTEGQFMLESVVYDDGSVPINGNTLEAYTLCTANVNPDVCNSVGFANQYEKPVGGILTRIAVAPYYDNEFSSGTAPNNAPRDFKVEIREAASDGSPGDVLFELDVTDDRQNGNGGTLNFMEVDLTPYQDQLSDLPDTFYIAVSNTGSDINFLIMAVTEYEGNTDASNAISYLHRSDFGGWAPFHGLQSGGESILQNRVHPIRAAFLIPVGPVANEDEAEVPERIALSQNYPNPFNPTTTIEFALPQTAPVRLAVYDVLGREVAVLVDGMQVAGTHQVQVDARQWSSGMYFYTLASGGQQQTQRMLLVK